MLQCVGVVCRPSAYKKAPGSTSGILPMLARTKRRILWTFVQFQGKQRAGKTRRGSLPMDAGIYRQRRQRSLAVRCAGTPVGFLVVTFNGWQVEASCPVAGDPIRKKFHSLRITASDESIFKVKRERKCAEAATNSLRDSRHRAQPHQREVATLRPPSDRNTARVGAAPAARAARHNPTRDNEQ